MSISLIRVINQQTIAPGLSRDGSILIDKIDRSQGNSSSPPYSQIAKQKIYVPFKNPLDPSVKGYADFVPTDEVLLAAETDGSIGGLVDASRVSVSIVSSSLVKTPIVSSASHSSSTTSVNGSTFLSVTPDVSYVYLINLAGILQKIRQSDFASQTGSLITIADSKVTIGVPTSGWKVKVFANSKLSNQVTLA